MRWPFQTALKATISPQPISPVAKEPAGKAGATVVKERVFAGQGPEGASVHSEASDYEEIVEAEPVVDDYPNQTISELEEIYGGAGGEAAGMAAYPPRGGGRVAAHKSGRGDDYLTKSAALRAQFKERNIVSRDDDIEGIAIKI